MKAPKETIEIEGYAVKFPTVFPVPLKIFLKTVVSKIPSARTETDRVRFFRDWLRWAKTFEDQDVHEPMQRFREGGFSDQRFLSMATMFLRWARRSKSRRASAAALARWKQKKRVDRARIRGK